MRAALWLALLACGSCRNSDATSHAEPTASRVPPGSSPPAIGGRLVSSTLEVAGLEVETGSLRGSLAAASPALWGFSDLGLDLSQLQLEIALAKGGAPLPRLLPPGGLAVVNGGYFEADFRPSTWLKNAGVELAAKSDTSRGGVLALGAGQLYLGKFAGLSFEPELSVQSFPLIVEPEGQSGIVRDDRHRAARTIACLVGDRLHLIVIAAPRGEGPTLFETVDLLREARPRGFGCRVALNLDGGPSSGVWFGPRVPAKQRAPVANVAYALVISPR